MKTDSGGLANGTVLGFSSRPFLSAGCPGAAIWRAMGGRSGQVTGRVGVVVVAVLDDRLIEPETALDAPPSVKTAAVFLNLFLDQQSGTLGTLHRGAPLLWRRPLKRHHNGCPSAQQKAA
ncbi:MAG: hypothetical protein HY205_06485 [Nitrospirae bacterium]|nr:hypothetical protein [Nitrospirota bacterium]